MKPVTISLQKQLKTIDQTCSACQSLYETGIVRSNPAIMYAQVSLLKSLALQVFECARSVKVVKDNFDIFSFMLLLNNEDLFEWSEKINEEQNKISNYTSIEHSENSIFLQAFEEVWICVRENITELRQLLSQFNYCANQSSIFDENILKSIFFRNRVITPLMYFIFVWIGILRNLLQETGHLLINPPDDLIKELYKSRIFRLQVILNKGTTEIERELNSQPKRFRLSWLYEQKQEILKGSDNTEWCKIRDSFYIKETDRFDHDAIVHYIINNRKRYQEDENFDSFIFEIVNRYHILNALLDEYQNNSESQPKIRSDKTPSIENLPPLLSFFADDQKASQYLSNLVKKVHNIIKNHNKGFGREAMLYVYACEKGNLFDGKQIPAEIIEKELGIRSSSYYNYRKGGAKCDYTDPEYLRAIKYIQS